MRATASGHYRAPDPRLLTALSMSEHSRLKWQCRRGMRELDELLVGYLDTCYATDSDADKAAFRAILELADPELNAYLLQRQEPSSEQVARGIERILSRTAS